MSGREGAQTQCTFYDASAYFSEDEWRLLYDWQKELYGNIMKEIHQALIALGPLIATTVFSLRAKEKKILHPVDNDESGQTQDSQSCFTSTTSPEVAFNIKQEEKVLPKNPPTAEEREKNDCLSAEEPASIHNDNVDADVREGSIDEDCGHAVISFRLKDEQSFYDEDSEREESLCRPTGGSGMRRNVQAAEFINRPKSRVPRKYSPRNTNIEVLQNSPEQINANNVLQSENYWEKRESEANLPKLGFNNSQQKVGPSRKYNKSNLKNSHFCKGPPNALKTQVASELDESCSRKGEFKHLKGERSKISRYSCNDCGKSFFYKANLVVHYRSHSGEKPCSCNYCGKRFSRKDNLKRHMRMHSGERPYQCTECTKYFTWKESLKLHQRTHIKGDLCSRKSL